MPRREPADQELIRATYERTGSGRATARELNLHENTVYAALRRMRGKCLRCKNPAAVGKQYCPECLAAMSERMKERRSERRRLGLCAECDKPVAPPSRTLCAEHRLAKIGRQGEYDDRQRDARAGTLQGQPNERQRLRHIKSHYGQGGLDAWQRDGGACVICGTSYGKATIHLHHKDLGKTNNTAENLVCLCFECHQLVHRVLRNKAPGAALRWIADNYPGNGV